MRKYIVIDNKGNHLTESPVPFEQALRIMVNYDNLGYNTDIKEVQ